MTAGGENKRPNGSFSVPERMVIVVWQLRGAGSVGVPHTRMQLWLWGLGVYRVVRGDCWLPDHRLLWCVME